MIIDEMFHCVSVYRAYRKRFDKRRNLTDAFHWLEHEEYDATELTAATSESVLETAVFT